VDALLTNLSSPPLLFFFLGLIASLVRSDLEMPPQVAKFLILYLLFAIGFKGGVALAESDLTTTVWLTLGAAVALSCAVPVYIFMLLRNRLALADAAAIAATYGSISAVTFVTCASYLDANRIPWDGYMIAAMALMESPAIILGILLYRLFTKHNDEAKANIRWSELGRESMLNGSVLLITGSLVIGWISGERGMAQVYPLVSELFIGFLCLFLLDMGIVAAHRFRELRIPTHTANNTLGVTLLIPLAILFPLVNGALAMGLAWLLGLEIGNALLLTILGASASYIAVPAAMRLALPEANTGLFLPMSLAISFPFNLLIGIPLYHNTLEWLL
jgi:uncharacterized protein